MKKSLFIGLVAVAMILGGCAKKSIEIKTPTQASTATPAQNEQPATVVNEEKGVSEDTPEKNNLSEEEMKIEKMKAIESQAKKIYFDFDKYNIRADQVQNVDFDANLFNRKDAKEFKIRI